MQFPFQEIVAPRARQLWAGLEALPGLESTGDFRTDNIGDAPQILKIFSDWADSVRDAPMGLENVAHAPLFVARLFDWASRWLEIMLFAAQASEAESAQGRVIFEEVFLDTVSRVASVALHNTALVDASMQKAAENFLFNAPAAVDGARVLVGQGGYTQFTGAHCLFAAVVLSDPAWPAQFDTDFKKPLCDFFLQHVSVARTRDAIGAVRRASDVSMGGTLTSGWWGVHLRSYLGPWAQAVQFFMAQYILWQDAIPLQLGSPVRERAAPRVLSLDRRSRSKEMSLLERAEEYVEKYDRMSAMLESIERYWRARGGVGDGACADTLSVLDSALERWMRDSEVGLHELVLLRERMYTRS